MTQGQERGIKATITALLSPIFQDNFDRSEIVEFIFNDVVNDIEETADWSTLKEDEICVGDIEIALARVLKNVVETCYTATGE